MKPGTPPLQSSRLPDQLREAKGNKDRVVIRPRSLVPAMRVPCGRLIDKRNAAGLKHRMHQSRAGSRSRIGRPADH
ncbi:MAG: hypothetical protein M0P52_12110 [Rhodoferax sp.]|nr:hypothetical protein [Rhodoferax sp.]